MGKNFKLTNSKAEINSAFSVQPSFDFENSQIEKGSNYIAGIDEAGRGALAGPLAVGIVIFDKAFIKNTPEKVYGLIKDSKKLTPKRRELAYEYICANALSAEVGFASHRKIDQTNINIATEYAINQALRKLSVTPDFLLIDGNFKFNITTPYLSIKQGDNKSFTIAAASIMAKVKRDKLISRYDLLFPDYEFKKNKGYGTARHLESIKNKGWSPAHRKSYEPVRSLISGQEYLFHNED